MSNLSTRSVPTQADTHNILTYLWLDNYREIQDHTAPNICLGASKFMALKLLGFVRMETHLNDFFGSPWAKDNASEYPRMRLINAWGGDLTQFNSLFNGEVLPQVINNPAAVVRTEGEAVELEYRYFMRSPSDADQLLQQGVPLVVGVSFGAVSGHQKHHILMARNTDGNIWAIDPWPDSPGVVNLSDPREFKTPWSSFSKPFTLELASADEVTIPCKSCIMGFYRPPGQGMAGDYRYKLELAL